MMKYIFFPLNGDFWIHTHTLKRLISGHHNRWETHDYSQKRGFRSSTQPPQPHYFRHLCKNTHQLWAFWWAEPRPLMKSLHCLTQLRELPSLAQVSQEPSLEPGPENNDSLSVGEVKCLQQPELILPQGMKMDRKKVMILWLDCDKP